MRQGDEHPGQFTKPPSRTLIRKGNDFVLTSAVDVVAGPAAAILASNSDRAAKAIRNGEIEMHNALSMSECRR